jgi:2-polyprenyl-6-methoxyphenol hydroxylase-like FAD-dependent oxidoreductase
MATDGGSTSTIEADVLVVGAGPVGLTLAIALAQRNVKVLLVERRDGSEPAEVKVNHISARSMEIFRRLGVARKLRECGLPADFPNDVAYRTTTTGLEIWRTQIPCRRDRYTSSIGPDTMWPTPEPAHRANQMYFEPVLREWALASDGIDYLSGVEVTSLTAEGDGALAEGRHLESGDAFTIRARFAVGCDGPRSTIRHLIGAKLEGSDLVSRTQSTYIHAPSLLGMLRHQPAWITHSQNPRRCGSIFAIDGRTTWVVHNPLVEGEEFDTLDRHGCIRLILGVDESFSYEVLGGHDWIARRLVADKFREGPIFLCGDAAHLWGATAGYAMNAGIADADCLAWMLAARVAGWGGDTLLDAYELERKPITEQVAAISTSMRLRRIRRNSDIPAEIEDETPRGREIRARLGDMNRESSLGHYCPGGLNFGYYYDSSPVIVYDGDTAPAYTAHEFTQSTVPGCRLPHCWLPDGGSIYDALGNGFALLRSDPGIDTAALEDAAARQGLPLTVVDLDENSALSYDHKLVLARPDRHVAWRGDSAPERPDAIVAAVRGAGVASLQPAAASAAAS